MWITLGATFLKIFVFFDYFLSKITINRRYRSHRWVKTSFREEKMRIVFLQLKLGQNVFIHHGLSFLLILKNCYISKLFVVAFCLICLCFLDFLSCFFMECFNIFFRKYHNIENHKRIYKVLEKYFFLVIRNKANYLPQVIWTKLSILFV